MPRPSNKRKILTAAAAVTERHGAANLTLDRVAAQAAISKGGLLYHYPNKRALLEGMLDHLIEQMTDRVTANAAPADQPGAQLSALIQALTRQSKAERAMTQALLAAAAEDPALLERGKQHIQGWLQQAEALSPHGAVLILATEGLRLLDILGLLPSNKERDRLSKMLDKAAVDWA